MTKGKIVCKEKRGRNKIYLRIRVDQSTKRKYLKFRHELISKCGVERIKGSFGFTEIKTENGAEIEVFRNDDYMHLIIRGSKRLREEILKILFKYFEFPER